MFPREVREREDIDSTSSFVSELLLDFILLIVVTVSNPFLFNASAHVYRTVFASR